MPLNRREYLRAVTGAIAGGTLLGAEGELGIPGPFRGKVVAVEHKHCIRDGQYMAEPIANMLSRGMCELTGTQAAPDAWRRFFGPGDTVGIKMSPVGRPQVSSSAAMVRGIVAGLQSAGVKVGNIIVYERYRDVLEDAGIPSWLPEGVGLEWAAHGYTAVQQEMENYDPEHYVELPFTLPRSGSDQANARRSYFARFLTERVNKVINVPCLKTHFMAGVTLGLKNLSHGLVNNVSRSHDPGPSLRYKEFIPAVVGSPLVRSKTVLNILDGTRGLFHGGPGMTGYLAENFVWDHQTVYLATDTVALDRVGMTVLDAKRKKENLKPIAASPEDKAWPRPLRQPEYIDAACLAGLGESDISKINVLRIKLG